MRSLQLICATIIIGAFPCRPVLGTTNSCADGMTWYCAMGLRDVDWAEAFAELRQGPWHWGQSECVQALAFTNIHNTNVIEFLRRNLTSNDLTNRELAAYLLLVRGDYEDIAPYYVPKLQDPQYVTFDMSKCGCMVPVHMGEEQKVRGVIVREAVIPVICTGRAAVPHLIPLLVDEDLEVRASAWFALRSITGLPLDDYDPVRPAVDLVRATLEREHWLAKTKTAEPGAGGNAR